MTKYTGNDMELTFGGTDIPNLISVEIPENRGEYDATTAGSLDNEYLSGKRDRTITINALADTAEAAYDALSPEGATATLIFYPQGNSSTKPKRTVQAFVTSRTQPENHAGITPLNVTLRATGAFTDGAVT